MTYILGADAPGGCVFCTKPAEDRDRENGILFRGQNAFVILNAYPYNPGHLMIIPFAHVPALEDLETDTTHELMDLTRVSAACLREALNPDGLNIGINQGRPAGAGIAGHIHQHIVPRWSGDTNYMTTVANTKVLPELVDETWERLAPFFRDRQ